MAQDVSKLDVAVSGDLVYTRGGVVGSRLIGSEIAQVGRVVACDVAERGLGRRPGHEGCSFKSCGTHVQFSLVQEGTSRLDPGGHPGGGGLG